MALSAKTRTADCSARGVESAVWLFWTQNTAGNLRAAQALMASCHSPRDVAPSPMKEMATRESGVGGRGSEGKSLDADSDSRLPTPDPLIENAMAMPAMLS